MRWASIDNDSRQAEFPSLILSELSRSPQVANFVFEFGKPLDRLGLYTQVIERREIDLPVATWFQGGQNNGRCRDCSERWIVSNRIGDRK